MRKRTFAVVSGWLVACLAWTGTATTAQRSGMFMGSANDPAIAYASGALDNVVETLNRRLDAGTERLVFEGRSGYLRSVLRAIGLPVESQALVFSTGSLQGRRISPANPRAIFFDDRAALGWVRDGDVIEVAAQDAARGIVFYTLEQRAVEAPRFTRVTLCLGCHMTGDTLGVPGLLMFSSVPESDRQLPSATFMRPSMPIEQRFGGWFVTGTVTPGRSRAVTATEGMYDTDGYLSSSSDMAALMVLMHQANTLNLMIRAGWEARAADPALHPSITPESEARYAPILRALADDVVDSLLFIDEAPLEGSVQGSSGFAERFAAQGPRDSKGRSLRQLDLTTRLMRYPCSYLIYSPVFDGLPPSIRTLIYERLWQVLSGAETDARYRRALTLADRTAVVEILRETKPGLPSYFEPL